MNRHDFQGCIRLCLDQCYLASHIKMNCAMSKTQAINFESSDVGDIVRKTEPLNWLSAWNTLAFSTIDSEV